jgi:predicted DNA-binding transcriptional regulator AlpA
MNTTDRLLTAVEAAQYLTLSVKTLEAYRQKNLGPKFSRLGRRVVYRLADLDAYAVRHAVATVE